MIFHTPHVLVSANISLVFFWLRCVYEGSCNAFLCRRCQCRLSCVFSWHTWHFVAIPVSANALKRHFGWQAQQTPHFTLHTSHSPLDAPHFTLYTPHFTLHTLNSALYSPHFTLRTLNSTLRTIHSMTLYTPHSILTTSNFAVHTSHSTLYTPLQFTFHHFALHSLQCDGM